MARQRFGALARLQAESNLLVQPSETLPIRINDSREDLEYAVLRWLKVDFLKRYYLRPPRNSNNFATDPID